MEQLIILGSGIAGLTAAIYAARAELSPLVISGPEEGGQLTWTTEVQNFPGFPEGVQGPELIEKCKKQAEKFGAKFKTGIVAALNNKKKYFELQLEEEKIQAKAIIIATGASARWLGLESEKKYQGRGVSVCATCDGAFYKGKTVVVVGGGDSAMEEALFLTKFAQQVTIIHRRNEFRASKIMQERVFNNKKIKIIWDSEIQEFLGNKFLAGVKIKNDKTKKISELECEGVFLAIGHVPNTAFLKGSGLEIDEKGFLMNDRFMKTNILGIFAAGDVQDIRYKQAITAAGSGCMAAIEAEKYLGGIINHKNEINKNTTG